LGSLFREPLLIKEYAMSESQPSPVFIFDNRDTEMQRAYEAAAASSPETP
jgi:hypothetical protein